MADILNKRFALRKLLCNPELHETTESIKKEFVTPEREPAIRAQLADFARQLVAFPDKVLRDKYTVEERRKDWLALADKKVLNATDGSILAIDARTRPGHKIIDHFMPHFYEVKNYKGKSVRGLFTQDVLEKALLTNLLMHSTPYKSEIRRMITMTAGLGSVTKYRTVTSKAIIQFFGAKRVLDPCTGWGGRLLGCLAAAPDTYYVGCEPDPNTAAGLRNILADEALPLGVRQRATVIENPAEVALPDEIVLMDKFDMILTSPPYFNLELYTAGEQSTTTFPTWESWTEEWLKPVIRLSLSCLKEGGGSVSCWSVKNFKTDKKYPLADVTKRIHEEMGWKLVKTVSMTGSARPGAKGEKKENTPEKKSEEDTFCFSKA